MMNGDPPYNIPNYSAMGDEELNRMLKEMMLGGFMDSALSGITKQYPMPQAMGPQSVDQRYQQARQKQLVMEAARRKMSGSSGAMFEDYAMRNPIPAAVNPAGYPAVQVGAYNSSPTLESMSRGANNEPAPGAYSAMNMNGLTRSYNDRQKMKQYYNGVPR